MKHQAVAKAIAMENTRAVQHHTQQLLEDRIREKSEEQERIDALAKKDILKPRELRKYSPEIAQVKSARFQLESLKKHKVALQNHINSFESPKRSQQTGKQDSDPFTDGSELKRYQSKV